MISAAIMGHPARMAFIRKLEKKLPTATVVFDEHDDRWDTGRRSLLAFDPAASHHLVIQDDAILCRELLAGVEALVRFSGEHPVSLYTGSVRPRRRMVLEAVEAAKLEGCPWIQMGGPFWGVGLVIPTEHIPPLIEWCDRQAMANYDLRIAAWYSRVARKQCWYTLPSLVDHRPVEENPSLVEGRDGNRRAHWFLGTRKSALTLDWSRPPLTYREIRNLKKLRRKEALRGKAQAHRNQKGQPRQVA